MRHQASSVNNGRRAVKAIALAVCAFYVLVILLSSLFIIANANHEHDHNGEDGGCAACAQIVVCAKMIEHLGVTITTATTAVSIVGFILPPRFAASQINAISLISLKMRLNI